MEIDILISTKEKIFVTNTAVSTWLIWNKKEEETATFFT